MTSPLIRIPFILAATVGFHKAVTPPHPPPSAEEKAPSTFLEVCLTPKIIPHMVTIICWFTALAEIAVILSTQYPSNPLASFTLSLLVYKGPASPQNIRPTCAFYLGTCMAITGASVRLTCFRALGHLFTFEMSIRKDHRLVTDGPYGVVRHPGYAGLLLMAAGTLLWQGSSGSWTIECGVLKIIIGRLVASVYVATISTVVFGLLLRMFKEDEQLKRIFGREWDEWARRVPYLVIPWLY